MKLLNKKQAIANFDEIGIDWFLSPLVENFRFSNVDGDMDFRVEHIVIKTEEYSTITGIKPVNLHYYQSFHCGCEYDCCGCLSSTSIDVSNNGNGYISVFINKSFNY